MTLPDFYYVPLVEQSQAHVDGAATAATVKAKDAVFASYGGN